MTRAELAALLKSKYPSYASIPDDELVTRIVEKYPTYKSQITEVSALSTPPPPTKLQDGGTGTTPTSDTGLVGGFLQTSPLNPRNLYELGKGIVAPQIEAVQGAAQSAMGGNFLGAAAGALDAVRGGPALRSMIIEPSLRNAYAGGQSLEAGDRLGAAAQFAGAIPGNAGMLALGQENAGNPAALAGNLLGAFTAPKIAQGMGRATEAAVGATGRAVGAAAEPVVAGAKKVAGLARASTNAEKLQEAGSTAITTGAITLNPFVGLAAGATDLMRRVIPEMVDRWRNGGATSKEIAAAAKALEKAEADKIKYRGVSKDEFGAVQDHLKALEYEAKQAEKAAATREKESFKSAKAEVRIMEGSKGNPPAPPSVPPSMSSSGLNPAPVAPVAQPRLGTPTATEVPAPAAPAPKAGPNLADPVQFNKIIEPIKAERGPIPKERLDSVERLANQLTHQTRTALGNRPLTPDEVGAQLRRTFPKYDPAHLDQIAERVRAATPPTMPLERFADLMAQDGVPIMEITTQIKNMYRVSTKEANRAATAAHRSIPKKPKP